MNNVPWLLHDAELALWPAWRDGLPFSGPGAGRDAPSPLLHCKASLSIIQNFEEGAPSGQNWMAAEMMRASTWQVAVSFPDAAVSDQFGRMLVGLHYGGFRTLTVRFFDEATGMWTVLNFFYVTPSADANADSSQVMMRSVTLKSSWMQERTGQGDVPSMVPVVLGEVDWICGSQRITALTYDHTTQTWASTSRNLTGDGSKYVSLDPVSEAESADVVLSAYLPRLIEPEVPERGLPTSQVQWQNTALLRVGNSFSSTYHGLTLTGGLGLQTMGIVEPLTLLPQSLQVDEPMVVFRYLRAVYATIGHNWFCVPRLVSNVTCPALLDPPFRIASPGPVNPDTGQTGLVLLPGGAWIDGTCRVI